MFRLLPILLLAAACSGGGDDKGTPTDSAIGTLAACELAEERMTCPECSEGLMTCTFGETSVTRTHCGGCQAEWALFDALCQQGETADRETIEEQMECGPPTCVQVFDTCNDPCQPLCLDEQAAAEVDTSCDLGCTNPIDEGTCTNTDFGCGFE